MTEKKQKHIKKIKKMKEPKSSLNEPGVAEAIKLLAKCGKPYVLIITNTKDITEKDMMIDLQSNIFAIDFQLVVLSQAINALRQPRPQQRK